MFEALRTTAAIIFAVIGAWLAIIYPERLKLSFRSDTVARVPSPGGTGWGQLFAPVVQSTGILAVILVLGVVVPLLRAHKPDLPAEVLRGGAYGLLVALTIWQLWTVLLTLVPADRVKSYLDREDDRAKLIRGFRSPGSVVQVEPVSQPEAKDK